MGNISLRQEARNKLEYFLNNPGYFSVLVLGDNGVGKEYILKGILDNHNVSIVYPYEIGDTEETISSIFEQDYIIIKNVEQLSDCQQRIIFKLLSTEDGKIGKGKNRDFKRVIFTSSFNVDKLRDENEYLLNMFWDRISQLVVRIPSFKDSSLDILKHFESVWSKFKFQKYNKLPSNGDFQYWLKENCSNFSGNFRDLDKIVILWHQYRIIEYDNLEENIKSTIESKIFTRVKNDFENLTHFPTRKTDTSNIFEFEKGKTWEQIEEQFKSKFKTWAKSSFGTFKNAYSELKMPYRKMDEW